MMNISYKSQFLNLDPEYSRLIPSRIRNEFSGMANQANISVRLWGTHVQITINVLNMPDMSMISCGVTPQGTGKVFASLGSIKTGDHRYIEQDICLPVVKTTILSESDINGAEVLGGRTIVQSLLQTFESIFENIRLRIHDRFAVNYRDEFVRQSDVRYSKETLSFIRTFLGLINWQLMLNGSKVSDDCLTVVCNSFSRNHPRCFNLGYAGDTDIDPVLPPPLYYDPSLLADLKATILLKMVCGDTHAEFFSKHGYLLVSKDGYQITLKPGAFFNITDPHGRSARLCVHTVNLSCNPIDEVVIAYLHIQNDFESWLRTANVFSNNGFKRPWELDKAA